MKAREGVMSRRCWGLTCKSSTDQLCQPSDTATFDNCLELLTMAGYPISQAVMMMIPEPWNSTP